ncbi:MAG TPA: ribonuclease P protein component [Burkholderiaceae bacterium]|nr:ribonuclease P protein component [Burkholderiaceae bacterium]
MQRLQHRADFERVLGAGAAAVVARSAHFVVHHLAPSDNPGTAELSTTPAAAAVAVVDPGRTRVSARRPCPPGAARVGVVIPKRWARRSVTRSLLKRQVFAAFDRLPAPLPAGDWVVRLRAPFDAKQFPSAASEPLKRAARQELDGLLAHARARLARSAAAAGPAPARPPAPR